LGGEIALTSTPGVGSTFRLYLPLNYAGEVQGEPMSIATDVTEVPRTRAVHAIRRTEPSHVVIPDDRENLQPDDHVMLIVEDDPSYGRVIVDLARANGFKVLVASTGGRCARARQALPAHCRVARRIPAGHAGLDRAQHVEARPGDAAHTRADRHARRGSPARARARGVSPTSASPRRPMG